MKMRFFSYDPLGDDFVLHATAEEAKKAAQEAIHNSLDGGEWCEEVEHICWGEVREHSTQCNVRERGEFSEEDALGLFPDGCDTMCDYELRALDNPDTAS